VCVVVVSTRGMGKRKRECFTVEPDVLNEYLTGMKYAFNVTQYDIFVLKLRSLFEPRMDVELDQRTCERITQVMLGRLRSDHDPVRDVRTMATINQMCTLGNFAKFFFKDVSSFHTAIYQLLLKQVGDVTQIEFDMLNEALDAITELYDQQIEVAQELQTMVECVLHWILPTLKDTVFQHMIVRKVCELMTPISESPFALWPTRRKAYAAMLLEFVEVHAPCCINLDRFIELTTLFDPVPHTENWNDVKRLLSKAAKSE
jgi:hypothetical protein